MHVNPIANLRECLAAAGPADEVVVKSQDLVPLHRLVYQDPDALNIRTACDMYIEVNVPREYLEELLAAFGLVLAAAGWTLDEFAALLIRDIAGTLGDIFAAHVRGLPPPWYPEAAHDDPCGPHCPGWKKYDCRSEPDEGYHGF
jgi:hypothetical protein